MPFEIWPFIRETGDPDADEENGDGFLASILFVTFITVFVVVVVVVGNICNLRTCANVCSSVSYTAAGCISHV